MQDTQKVRSARNSLYQVVMYFNQALAEAGCIDCKKEIATDIARAISFTNDQKDFILAEANYNIANDLLKDIKSCLEETNNTSFLDKKKLTTAIKEVEILEGILNAFRK